MACNDDMTFVIYTAVFVLLIALMVVILLMMLSIAVKQGKSENKPNDTDMSKRHRYYTSSYGHASESRYSPYGGQTSESRYSPEEAAPAKMAVIYRSEMDYISRCIRDYPNIETGGQLFGFLTENGAPVVCYAIGPGRNANHQAAFFNQDTEYLQSVYNQLNRRYGLRYIGEWHSHHQLGLAKPSGHDASTIVHGMQRSHFRHFLLCIGNCDRSTATTLNAYTFHIDSPYEYHHAPWKIIEMDSPYRSIVDMEMHSMLVHPYSDRAVYGPNYIISESGGTSMVTPRYEDEYWLNNKANNLELKKIMDYLAVFDCEPCQVKAMLDQEKHVSLLVQMQSGTVTIGFGSRFPSEAPMIVPSIGVRYNADVAWSYDGDIFEAFRCYFDAMFKDVPMPVTPVDLPDQLETPEDVEMPGLEEISGEAEAPEVADMSDTQEATDLPESPALETTDAPDAPDATEATDAPDASDVRNEETINNNNI